MNARKPPFTRDLGTWVSYLLLGYFSFTLSTFGSFLPFLRLELGLTFAQTSAHSSVFALGLLGASLSTDRLSRRFGVRLLFWGGALGMAIGAAIVMLASNLVASLSGFFLMGGLGALTLIQVSAVLSAKHGPNRTRALSEANVLASFCAVLAPLTIGGAVGLGLGWRGGLSVAPLFLGVLGVLFWQTPFPRTEHTLRSQSSLPGRYWRFWTVLLLCVAAEFGTIFWAVDFLSSGEMTRATASLGLSGFLLAMLVGRTLGTRLAGQQGAERVVLGSLVLAFLGFLAYWLGGAAWLQLTGLFFTGLGVANLYPFVLSLALSTAPDALETASARISLASGVAILFAPFVLGTLADLSTLAAAQVFLPLCLGAAFITMWLATRAKPELEFGPVS